MKSPRLPVLSTLEAGGKRRSPARDRGPRAPYVVPRPAGRGVQAGSGEGELRGQVAMDLPYRAVVKGASPERRDVTPGHTALASCSFHNGAGDGQQTPAGETCDVPGVVTGAGRKAKQKTGAEELGAPRCMGLREATLRTWLGVGGGTDSAGRARGRGDSR